jgi:hypothetical protein
VENCGNLREPEGGARAPQREACSACAGDYEDPDRTAWNADEDEEAEEQASAEQVPVSKG